ncbi:MAG: CPBP family glutamic-type intramembrane protease [Pyrinomonadaceae bacterium]
MKSESEFVVAREGRRLAAWEIASVVSSTIIAEWAVLALSDANKLLLAVPIGLAFALMFYSHHLRGETLREIGWRVDNFGRALKLLLPAMLGASVLLALVGWLWFGERVRLGGPRAGWEVLGLPVWGFLWGLMQQYALQGFINRRAQLIWGKGARSIVLVALIFGLLHLPNPWLTAVTFLGGLLWAFVYQCAPNLWALALSHAALTCVLVSTLPLNALRGLRVGYKFFG